MAVISLHDAPLAARPARALCSPLVEHDLCVAALRYGDSARSGQTCVSIVLHHFGIPAAIGGGDLLEQARWHGMRAEMMSQASLAELALLIDRGVPSITLVDPLQQDGTLGRDDDPRWVVVSGYEGCGARRVARLCVSDPCGARYSVGAEHFLRSWANLERHGLPTGDDRLMLSMVPSGSELIRGADGISRPADSLELPMRWMPRPNR